MWLRFHFSDGSYSFRFLFYSSTKRKSQDRGLNNVLHGRRYCGGQMYLRPCRPRTDPVLVYQRRVGKYPPIFDSFPELSVCPAVISPAQIGTVSPRIFLAPWKSPGLSHFLIKIFFHKNYTGRLRTWRKFLMLVENINGQ